MDKLKLFYKNSPVHAILMIISFLVFIALYSIFTISMVEPYYIKGLIFGVPFFFFGLMYYLTVKSFIKLKISKFITFVFTIIFLVALPFEFLYFSFDSATTSTTDVRRYERALRLSHFSEFTEVFPEKIPKNAENIKFYYTPPFGQGGRELALKFEIDSDTLNTYKEKFSGEAKWTGKDNDTEAKEHGVFRGLLSQFDSAPNSNPPGNYVVYVFFSEPYRTGDWNHGKRSLAAINEQNNTVIFHAEIW